MSRQDADEFPPGAGGQEAVQHAGSPGGNQVPQGPAVGFQQEGPAVQTGQEHAEGLPGVTRDTGMEDSQGPLAPGALTSGLPVHTFDQGQAISLQAHESSTSIGHTDQAGSTIPSPSKWGTHSNITDPGPAPQLQQPSSHPSVLLRLNDELGLSMMQDGSTAIVFMSAGQLPVQSGAASLTPFTGAESQPLRPATSRQQQAQEQTTNDAEQAPHEHLGVRGTSPSLDTSWPDPTTFTLDASLPRPEPASSQDQLEVTEQMPSTATGLTEAGQAELLHPNQPRASRLHQATPPPSQVLSPVMPASSGLMGPPLTQLSQPMPSLHTWVPVSTAHSNVEAGADSRVVRPPTMQMPTDTLINPTPQLPGPGAGSDGRGGSVVPLTSPVARAGGLMLPAQAGAAPATMLGGLTVIRSRPHESQPDCMWADLSDGRTVVVQQVAAAAAAVPPTPPTQTPHMQQQTDTGAVGLEQQLSVQASSVDGEQQAGGEQASTEQLSESVMRGPTPRSGPAVELQLMMPTTRTSQTGAKPPGMSDEPTQQRSGSTLPPSSSPATHMPPSPFSRPVAQQFPTALASTSVGMGSVTLQGGGMGLNTSTQESALSSGGRVIRESAGQHVGEVRRQPWHVHVMYTADEARGEQVQLLTLTGTVHLPHPLPAEMLVTEFRMVRHVDPGRALGPSYLMWLHPSSSTAQSDAVRRLMAGQLCLVCDYAPGQQLVLSPQMVKSQLVMLCMVMPWQAHQDVQALMTHQEAASRAPGAPVGSPASFAATTIAGAVTPVIAEARARAAAQAAAAAAVRSASPADASGAIPAQSSGTDSALPAAPGTQPSEPGPSSAAGRVQLQGLPLGGPHQVVQGSGPQDVDGSSQGTPSAPVTSTTSHTPQSAARTRSATPPQSSNPPALNPALRSCQPPADAATPAAPPRNTDQPQAAEPGEQQEEGWRAALYPP